MLIIFGIIMFMNRNKDDYASFSTNNNFSTKQTTTTTTTTKKKDDGLGNPDLIQNFGENYTSIFVISIVLVVLFIFFFYYLGRKKEW